MRHALTCLLACCLLVLTLNSAASAQSAVPDNARLGKRACDYLTEANARAILEASVQASGDGVIQCRYIGPGLGANRKQVQLQAWFWASPRAIDLQERRENILRFPVANTMVQELPGLGDAAIWMRSSTRLEFTLWAFRGGTAQVEILITGLPEDVALRQAKELAAKAIGGSSPTGYAYTGTNSTVTQASTAPAPAPRGTLTPLPANQQYLARITLKEYAAMPVAQQNAAVIALARQYVSKYPEFSAATMARFTDKPDGIKQVNVYLATEQGKAAKGELDLGKETLDFLVSVAVGAIAKKEQFVNPKDASWVDRLPVAEAPVTLKGLFLGDFRQLQPQRRRVLSYIGQLNDEASLICPQLHDEVLAQEVPAALNVDMARVLSDAARSADMVAYLRKNEADEEDAKLQAQVDSVALYGFVPDPCTSVIFTKIFKNMRLFTEDPRAGMLGPALPAR